MSVDFKDKEKSEDIESVEVTKFWIWYPDEGEQLLRLEY